MSLNTVYNEDNIITLSNMPDSFIDLVVTSPPYDGLRDYKGFPVYNLKRHRDTAKLLFQKLKEGGVIVWVVNDSKVDGTETCTSFRQALLFKKAGFRLNDTMIWTKEVCPQPSKGVPQYYQAFEYMFVFSKGKPKTFNRLRDRKNKNIDWKRKIGKDNSVFSRKSTIGKTIKNSDFCYRYNYWYIETGFNSTSSDTFAFNHPAIFPEKLAKDHILSWSNEGDLVYDPFMGSGTVAKCCIELKRNWIGSEISKDYIEIINKRINHSQPGLL